MEGDAPDISNDSVIVRKRFINDIHRERLVARASHDKFKSNRHQDGNILVEFCCDATGRDLPLAAQNVVNLLLAFEP
jgi:hypothetical protein